MDDSTVIRFPNDNTVLRPTPGGRRQTAGNTEGDKTRINPRARSRSVSAPKSAPTNNFNLDAVQYKTPAYTQQDNYLDPVQYIENGSGINPLLHHASAIISIIVKLNESVLNDDISQLKFKLQDELKQFEVRASRSGIANDKILQARYVLCTALDESVVSTPWGQESDWSQQSLLSIFHGETWGGEKFYLLLERLLKEPLKNLDILELMYILLSLGFQGKFRVMDNGRGEVDYLREDLYRQIRSLKNDFNKELSVNWQGISDRRGALIRYVPLWVVGALSGVILLAMFASFTYMLDQSSSPVLNEIQQLGLQSNSSEEIENSHSIDNTTHPAQMTTPEKTANKADKQERLVRPKPYYSQDEVYNHVIPEFLSVREVLA